MTKILLKDIRVGDEGKDVLIEKGIISKIGMAGSCSDWLLTGDLETVECGGKVAVPGFVNMHTHSGMSMMRGLGEDMPFSDWIDKIWKIESRIDSEFVYWSGKISCLEMIRTGTTTFNDHYWSFRRAQQAASELGLRIATGFVFLNHNDISENEREKEMCIKWTEEALSSWDKDSICQISIHAIYSVNEEMLVWARDFADKNGLNIHIHLSETRKEVEDCKTAHGGLTPVEYLAELGLLSPRTLAAHTLWLTEHDIELLAKYKVNCIHNINSNTKLSSGYRFLYNEMRDAGINICLGTDGCASSNNLDMLEAMKTSAIFQKAWREDPTAMSLNELMEMATVNGATALGFNGGKIEEGAVADINIVDTDSTFFLSPGPFMANFIYSAHSDCIDSVIRGGRFLMKNHVIQGEREILANARKIMERII